MLLTVLFLVTGRLSAAKVLYTDVNSKKIIPPAEVNGFAADMMDVEEISDGLDDSEESPLAAAVYFHMESLIGSMIALEEWRSALAKRPE
jgi:nuclear pore complex protein Nup107